MIRSRWCTKALITGCGAAALCVASRASAALIDITPQGTTLAQVVGNQFMVGDKLFSVPSNGFQSVAFDPSQIFISPLVNGDPMTGQGFRLTGAMKDPPGGGGSDFVLKYTVQVDPNFVAQGYRIDDADLRFNGAATGDGSYSRVDETLLDSNNNILVNKSVYAYGGGTPYLDDHSDLAPITLINVVKDVQFFANGADGTASASFVDQSFSQTVIPLPTAAGIAAAGLGILAGARRRAG
jgi:hypothetical protein